MLLMTLSAAFAPNGFWIDRQLSAAADEIVLPRALLRQTVAEAWVIFHHREEWSRAFFTAGTSGGLDLPGVRRPLPGLRVPRIYLHEPTYREKAPCTDLVAIEHLAVDVAEYYFHALFEALLHRQVAQPDSSYRAFAEQRALALGPRLGENLRPSQFLGAYLTDVAEFAAHLQSIANEIWRAALRLRQREKNPCALLDPKVPLLSLWEQRFQNEWKGSSLWPEDRQRFIDDVLGGLWSGDAKQDFAALCGPGPVSLPE